MSQRKFRSPILICHMKMSIALPHNPVISENLEGTNVIGVLWYSASIDDNEPEIFQNLPDFLQNK
jgi:hypothetical protein